VVAEAHPDRGRCQRCPTPLSCGSRRQPWFERFDVGPAAVTGGRRLRMVVRDEPAEFDRHRNGAARKRRLVAQLEVMGSPVTMVASMLAGLSGRRYSSALEPVGQAVEAVASGTSQSTVSRRFVAATGERLAEFRTRDLSEPEGRWLICFVDGFDFAGHTMVGALGVTADGIKVPLGVVEGSTENASVIRGLIAGLRDRGLDASEGILFVLDGAKALAKPVRGVFPTRR